MPKEPNLPYTPPLPEQEVLLNTQSIYVDGFVFMNQAEAGVIKLFPREGNNLKGALTMTYITASQLVKALIAALPPEVKN